MEKFEHDKAPNKRDFQDLPANTREAFARYWRKFSEATDMRTLEDNLDGSPTSVLAFALYHCDHSSPSFNTPDTIAHRQNLLKQALDGRGVNQERFLQFATKDAPKNFPRLFSLALLGTYPVDQSLLSLDQKKQLVDFVIMSLSLLQKAETEGIAHVVNLCKSREDVQNAVATGDQELVARKISDIYPQGISDFKYPYHQFMSREILIELEFHELLQALGRNGFLNWPDFFDASTLSAIEQNVSERIRTMIDRRLGGAPSAQGERQWISDSPLESEHEFLLAGTSAMTAGSFEGVNLLILGSSGGPLHTLRLNFEINMADGKEKVHEKLAAPIRAITQTFMSGMPIFCKVTLSDLRGDNRARLMVYADYETCRRVISALHNIYKSEQRVYPNPVLRTNERGVHSLHPFGTGEISVRGTQEAEYDAVAIDAQLESLRIH